MKMNEQVYAKKQSTSINHLTSSSVTVDAINSRKPVALLSTPISDRPRLPNASLPMVAPAKVEIKKISSGLMLAQSYNSETEDDDDEDNVDGLNTNLPTEQEVAYGKEHNILVLNNCPIEIYAIRIWSFRFSVARAGAAQYH